MKDVIDTPARSGAWAASSAMGRAVPIDEAVSAPPGKRSSSRVIRHMKLKDDTAVEDLPALEQSRRGEHPGYESKAGCSPDRASQIKINRSS